MSHAAAITPARRQQILRVLIISLLLDLISFTFILPLFPQLLEFYRNLEAPGGRHARAHADGPASLLTRVLAGLNAYKRAFARPISDRYDIVLLGGGLGSLFSLLQALAAPVIGRLSDRHGRRTALLACMAGNLLSVALWVAATDFRTFVASRVVAGLSEGNVQLATAIAADISDERSRGSTMALIGACFSVAFTVGPALGAALATVSPVAANPFGTAAAVSLGLIAVETAYLYRYLPETLPSAAAPSSATAPRRRSHDDPPATTSTNSHRLLNSTHFLFLFFFSGLEFSLPFLTYDLFGYGGRQSGRLLGFIGLVASLLQAGVTRRLDPLRAVQAGVLSAVLAFFVLDRLRSERALYAAAALLALTSATVVTGLRSLSSFEAAESERGEKMGNHRSWGQVGRALGPVVFCTLYWWAGRELAYRVGGVGMLAVAAMAVTGLKSHAVRRRVEEASSARGKAGVSSGLS
ncbi:MAG: hypothetical protein M1826_003985 [Phylliscum demangeonii]|nr:MAG: hypothetical protein M1826_003985 [Phylliscum demangeonii]